MKAFEATTAVLAIYLTVTFVGVKGHGNGAPENRCESMGPGHWVASQTTPCPYTVTLDKAIVPAGSPVTLSLSVISPDQPGFKGFFVMVKKPHSEQSKNYGVFDLNKSDLVRSQPVNCFGRVSSAMTHKDNIEKSLVRLVWVSPSQIDSSSEDFEVKVTFVQNFWTIWANLTGPQKITVVKIINEPTNNEPSNIHSFINLAPQSPAENETNTGADNSSSFSPVIIHKSFHLARDAMTIVNDIPPPPAKTESDKTNNSKMPLGSSSPPSNMDNSGAWGHFRNMWMSVLNYFGA